MERREQGRPSGEAHAHVQVAVSSASGHKHVADQGTAQQPWYPDVWGHEQPRMESAPQPPAPQTPPPTPPPARGSSSALRRWLLFGGVILGAALLAGTITLIVLRKKGVLGSSSESYTPLPYYQRDRNTTAEPAFAAELHPWLLPSELTTLGAQLSADVIIIGAGVAGLRAAQVLSANMSVVVLEARDRVGGRIHSEPFGGLTAELGAQFIRGSESGIDAKAGRRGNPLTELSNTLGLTRVAASSGSAMHRMYGSDGQPLTSKQRQNLSRWAADLRALTTAAAANQSLADVLQQPQMLNRVGNSPANLAVATADAAARYGVQYGGRLEQLSALYFDNHTSYGGVDNAVIGGFSQIPDSLAAQALGSGAQLRLNTPVLAIRHGDSNATVVTATGELLTAQYIVCTAPLGVLRSEGIQLDPPLPEQTAAAAARLGVGRLEKLWLEFDSAFWSTQSCGSGEQAAPCEQLGYLAATSNSSGWRRFVSLTAYTGRPVLVALAAAAWAEQLEGMSDEDVVASALADLAGLFPVAVPQAQLRAYRLTRWGQEPWAMGSLSFYAVGSTPNDRATLAEPQSGSLLLAGEASSVLHPGTVHGAYLSGQEAAYRVLDAAAELPQCGSSSGSSAGSSDGGACVTAPSSTVAGEVYVPDCVCEWPPLLEI